MTTPTRSQRRYDYRLREHVLATQDTNCALQQGVPRSTARGWLKNPSTPVISVNPLELDTARLQQEVLRLRSRAQKLVALLRVLLVVLRMSGYALNQIRIAGGNHKRSLLRAIQQSRAALPLRAVLRVVRLSPARFHDWNKEERCALDDRSLLCATTFWTFLREFSQF